MLAEPVLMRCLNPRNVDRTIEADDSVDTTVRADCCVAQLVAVTPLHDTRRRELGEAVETDCYFTGQQLGSVH